MSNIITTRHHLQQLIIAANAVQARLDDGTIGRAFGDGSEDDAHSAVSAFDNLDKAATLVANEDKIASPFLRYRREILGKATIGTNLRSLVLNLWGGKPSNLSRLFHEADEHHTRIALECLVHYSIHGENDSHFMGLASEIAGEQHGEAA